MWHGNEPNIVGFVQCTAATVMNVWYKWLLWMNQGYNSGYCYQAAAGGFHGHECRTRQGQGSCVQDDVMINACEMLAMSFGCLCYGKFCKCNNMHWLNVSWMFCLYDGYKDLVAMSARLVCHGMMAYDCNAWFVEGKVARLGLWKARQGETNQGMTKLAKHGILAYEESVIMENQEMM